MAKYKKRPDGRYATSTIVGYTDDGKPKRKTLYGRTIMELDKKVAEFKSLQNKGIIINDEGMTVEQWGKKWLELYKADKAYNTYLMYQNALNTHIIPNLGNIRLNALKSHHIQELLNSIIRDGHHRTAEIVKITIKQIIQQAIINEYIYKDISLGLTLPNKKKPKKRALTDAEKKLIFKADFNSMERVFIDLLYYTGIRKGEALSLTVGDIDFINKKISISKNLVMQYRSSTIKPSPKTQSGNREIPIPDKLLQSLMNYIHSINSIYLFTTEDGNLLTLSEFRKIWRDVIYKLNLAAGGTIPKQGKRKKEDVSIHSSNDESIKKESEDNSSQEDENDEDVSEKNDDSSHSMKAKIAEGKEETEYNDYEEYDEYEQMSKYEQIHTKHRNNIQASKKKRKIRAKEKKEARAKQKIILQHPKVSKQMHAV